MGAGLRLASLGIDRPELPGGAAAGRRDRPIGEERPGSGKLPGNHTMSFPRQERSSSWQDTRWDHGLTVTGEGQGLVGHAGAVLLRKLADQAGLTAALGAALARKGKFPLIDRGVALVSMAVAIALGATSMTDITVLAHHAPVLGAEPSDTTVRRTLELADPATLDKIARVRARVRAHVWSLIARGRPGSRGWPSPGRCWRAGWSSTWTAR